MLKLSERELETRELLDQNLTYQDIAAELGLSLRRVGILVKNVRLKEMNVTPCRGYPKRGSPLSRRELEAARLFADGKTYSEVASAMGIEPDTAKYHAASIRQRLGAANMTQAVAMLIRAGTI